jgi:hypothetical protein
MVFNALPYNLKEIACIPNQFKVKLRDFLNDNSFYTLNEFLIDFKLVSNLLILTYHCTDIAIHMVFWTQLSICCIICILSVIILIYVTLNLVLNLFCHAAMLLYIILNSTISTSYGTCFCMDLWQ